MPPEVAALLSDDVLLHGRCGRKISEHPVRHALDALCSFPELPPVEFRPSAEQPTEHDRAREAARLHLDDDATEDEAQGFVAGWLAHAERDER